MQYCDVSQLDWHPGQILYKPNSPIHAVFIDFSASTQTLDLDTDPGSDDYANCVTAIAQGSLAGLDREWVFDFWKRSDMLRDDWDAASSAFFADFSCIWKSEIVDPYKFAYDGLVNFAQDVGQPKSLDK